MSTLAVIGLLVVLGVLAVVGLGWLMKRLPALKSPRPDIPFESPPVFETVVDLEARRDRIEKSVAEMPRPGPPEDLNGRDVRDLEQWVDDQ